MNVGIRVIIENDEFDKSLKVQDADDIFDIITGGINAGSLRGGFNYAGETDYKVTWDITDLDAVKKKEEEDHE